MRFCTPDTIYIMYTTQDTTTMTWTALPEHTFNSLTIERREHANGVHALSVKIRAKRTQAEQLHELQLFKQQTQAISPNSRLTGGELRLIEGNLYRLIAYFSPVN